jgi:cytochrome P450 family 142 subfamily A polypeptide 1
MPRIDVFDPELYAGDPFPVYAALRREDPVHWDEKNRVWVLSRYADVVHVSKNPQIFCSRFGVTREDTPISIITMDDPRHSQVRRLVSRGFTPRMVATLERRIEEVTTASIDLVASRGACDFAGDLAVPLPLLVIAEMIGIRPEDRDAFHEWSDAMIVAASQQDRPEIITRATDAYLAYTAYLQDVFAERRREPRDDLVSILLQAQEDGTLAKDDENLSADELLQFMTILLVAGNETTRNAISGGMVAFSENPEEWQRLRENPELLPLAVEEILRWVTPVVGFRRTVLEDTEIRGRPIRAGDRVVMLYQSANRDEEAFVEAHRFRVDRRPNDHLAFGIGTHFCLGANLARAEIRVMYRELLRRLPDIRMAPGARPEMVRSPLVRGIARLPVVFTPEPRSRRADAASAAADSARAS